MQMDLKWLEVSHLTPESRPLLCTALGRVSITCRKNFPLLSRWTTKCLPPPPRLVCQRNFYRVRRTECLRLHTVFPQTSHSLLFLFNSFKRNNLRKWEKKGFLRTLNPQLLPRIKWLPVKEAAEFFDKHTRRQKHICHCVRNHNNQTWKKQSFEVTSQPPSPFLESDIFPTGTLNELITETVTSEILVYCRAWHKTSSSIWLHAARVSGPTCHYCAD